MTVCTGTRDLPPDAIIEIVDERSEEAIAPCTLIMPWYVTLAQVRCMLDYVRPGWLRPLQSDKCRQPRRARLDARLDKRIWALASGDRLPPGEVQLFIRQERGVCDHDDQKRVLPTEPPGSLTLGVKTLTGKRIVLSLKKHHTVDCVRWEIQNKEGIPPNQQRLIWHGRQLPGGPSGGDDSRMLCELGVCDGDELMLVLSVKGC